MGRRAYIKRGTPQFVQELKKIVPKGWCLGCERIIPEPREGKRHGRPRDWCDDPDCRRLYASMYRIEYREAGLDSWVNRERKK